MTWHFRQNPSLIVDSYGLVKCQYYGRWQLCPPVLCLWTCYNIILPRLGARSSLILFSGHRRKTVHGRWKFLMSSVIIVLGLWLSYPSVLLKAIDLRTSTESTVIDLLELRLQFHVLLAVSSRIMCSTVVLRFHYQFVGPPSLYWCGGGLDNGIWLRFLIFVIVRS